MLNDFCYACRTLFRSPLFTVLTVLVLALGIGANTAVFSAVYAVLLRPFPYPHSEQLCSIRVNHPMLNDASICYADYMDWCAGQHSFADLMIVRRLAFNVSFPPSAGFAPEKIKGAAVSYNYLSVLGMPPTHGRDFTAAEDVPGGPATALLSDGFWRRRFGADPAVIGRDITLDGMAYKIIGVMAPQVNFPRGTEIAVTLRNSRGVEAETGRGRHVGYTALGRLRPGVTFAQGRADLDGIAADLARRYPQTNADLTISMFPLLEYNVRDLRRGLWLLFGAVACVLLVACANVAGLQLVHATARTRDLAVHAALGAARWRLLRLLLTESFLLGALGGVLGVLLATWLVDIIVDAGGALPRFQEVRLDLPALGFAVAVSVGAGLLAGIWPAWRMSRVDALVATLHRAGAARAGGSVGRSRAQGVFLVVQVVLAITLLTGAGLGLRGFHATLSQPVGFRTAGLLTASLSLPEKDYPPGQARQFTHVLLERARAMPDVDQAAIIFNPPFDEIGWRSNVHVVGGTSPSPSENVAGQISVASPGYFAMMGVPILRGRDFGPQDTPDQPAVAIIDANLAEKEFAGCDPIGQRLDQIVLADGTVPPFVVIVGVVPHINHNAPGDQIDEDDMPQCYLAVEQFSCLNTQLMVRTKSGEPLRIVDQLRWTVSALNADLPLSDITTMDQRIADNLAPQRTTMMLLGAFAAVALGLATMGVYGLVALGVTQRTRELGIRLALGAQRPAVIALVLRRVMISVGIGLGLGLAASFGLVKILTLNWANSADLLMISVVCMGLATAALMACWMPVRRIIRLDPITILRDE